MNSIQIIPATILKSDEVLEVSRRKLYKATPNYFKIGNGTYSKRYNLMALDLIYEMSIMTPQELWFINELKKAFLSYETTEAFICTSSLSSSDRQKMQKAYSRLHAKNLVRRIKRQHYLINPDLIIPNDYQGTREIWDNLI